MELLALALSSRNPKTIDKEEQKCLIFFIGIKEEQKQLSTMIWTSST